MQRLACLILVLTAVAACGGGTETGEATMSVVMPPAKSASARTFVGADAAGTMVHGWKIEFFADSPGEDCTSEDLNNVATIGIYSNKASTDGAEAMLPIGGITIVSTAPPMVLGSAAANLTVEGVAVNNGVVDITEFHLAADGKTADRIKGSVTASATDSGSGGDVQVTATFTAPVCESE